MYIKQSLVVAENEAKAHSIKFPDLVCYVIDKRKGRACWHTLEWAVRDKIAFSGYYPVCTYKNGVRH